MSTFDDLLKETKEYGVVEEIKYPLAICSGLPGAFLDEQVYFENGDSGQVMQLLEDKVEIVLFAKIPVQTGMKVTRSGAPVSVRVGNTLLGKVTDPLGNGFFEVLDLSGCDVRTLDAAPLPIGSRKKISQQLHTGVTLIDTLLPLGKGQREMVVGDRQTGKSWILLNIMLTQAQAGAMVVYALVGKEINEIAKIKYFIKHHHLEKRVVVVATDSDDSPSLISLTPYTAMTVAEYFRDQKKDVVVLIDDLSTHAIYYREIALIARRFPGRDSYPGDMFYRHARLLERAGNFLLDGHEVSISCVTIASTVGNYLTGHVVSNLIGITDGHILFDSELFNMGRRPAIHPFLSVTRVGKQTQTPLARSLQREVSEILAEYNELQEFAHFGTELPEEKKQIMTRAEKLYQLFSQTDEENVPYAVQHILLIMILSKMLDTVENSIIPEYRSTFAINYLADTDVRIRVDAFLDHESLEECTKAAQGSDVLLLSLCTQKR